MKIENLILLLLLFFSQGFLLAADNSTRKDYRLDNEFFRRGLIDRGLDDWLKIYDKEHPPASDLDLLAQEIGRAWLEYRRTSDPAKRAQALETLLKLELDRVESYPDHPLSANWRVRYAGDLLNEKLGAQTFIHLLNLDLPGEYRKSFIETLDEIETQLDKASQFLSAKLGEFEHLNNIQLTQINRQGLPELYQSARLQSDYLRSWCRFHRAKLLQPGSPEQVKVLYQLSDLADRLGDTSSGSEKLLSAGVARMLGKFPQAKAALDQARKTLPATYLLFADIEQALLDLAENHPQQALKAVTAAQQRPLYKNDPPRQNLVTVALLVLDARARTGTLSGTERADSAVRNQILKNLTAELVGKPQLRVFAFPKLIEISESCPQDSLSDIELYAFAQRAMDQKKLPLAQNALQDFLGRSNVPSELKLSAALFLARIFEQAGRFSEAVTVLEETARGGKNSQTAELLAQSARLAWMAYRATPNDKQRSRFIEAAGRLLSQYPQSNWADQFKLLMAEEFSRTNEFNQALQWIQQVPPGSPLYLQARAARVLTLIRQFKQDTQSAGGPAKPGSAVQKLGDQIESACRELLVITSARQKDPEKIDRWTLDENQTQLLAGAILSTANILADPVLDRGKRAEELLARYRPILAGYQKSSKSALTVQITALTQTATAAGLVEAVHLSQQLIDKNELPPGQTVTAILGVLDAIHQSTLNKQADPLGPGDDLAQAALNLARGLDEKFGKSTGLTPPLPNRLRALYIITAVDAGKFTEAARLSKNFNPKTALPDLNLARARIHLSEKKFLETVSISAEVLQNLSPGDIRYWHALIINLRGHLALGSDPAQIEAAVIAREQEYPELGNTATKNELMKILKSVQKNKK